MGVAAILVMWPRCRKQISFPLPKEAPHKIWLWSTLDWMNGQSKSNIFPTSSNCIGNIWSCSTYGQPKTNKHAASSSICSGNIRSRSLLCVWTTFPTSSNCSGDILLFTWTTRNQYAPNFLLRVMIGIFVQPGNQYSVRNMTAMLVIPRQRYDSEATDTASEIWQRGNRYRRDMTVR